MPLLLFSFIQGCPSTSISIHLCMKGQLQHLIHWNPFINPLLYSIPSSASHFGLELFMVPRFSSNVLSHFLAFVLAVSSACEYLRSKDPV